MQQWLVISCLFCLPRLACKSLCIHTSNAVTFRAPRNLKDVLQAALRIFHFEYDQNLEPQRLVPASDALESLLLYRYATHAVLDIEAFAMEEEGLAASVLTLIIQNHAYSYLKEGAFKARRMTTGRCPLLVWDTCHLRFKFRLVVHGLKLRLKLNALSAPLAMSRLDFYVPAYEAVVRKMHCTLVDLRFKTPLSMSGIVAHIKYMFK